MAVRKYLLGEDTFLANYADGLTDMHLPSVIERFKSRGKIGNFVSIRPNLSFHSVSCLADGEVREIKPVRETDLRINHGFFMFRSEIFDYMRAGEELVEEPFQRLIAADQLLAYPYDGFVAAMDTFKDKQHFDELYAKGSAPWEVWLREPSVLDGRRHLRAEHPVKDTMAVKYQGEESFLSPLGAMVAEPAEKSARP
jgi:glucose-1-phosphate cytidylyltransferase